MGKCGPWLATKTTWALPIVLACACVATLRVASARAQSAADVRELSLQSQVEILNEALKAFDTGSALRQSNPTEAGKLFRTAAGRFQVLVDAGLRNGRLYYNLGNAYLECGQLGRAILNYRRAQEFIPEDARLVANLRYARSLRRNQLPESGEQAFLQTLFFWHYGTSLRGRVMAGLLVWIAFWGMLIARVFVPRFRWRYALLPVLVVCMVLAASIAASLVAQSRHQAGVVVADNITVRKGNGEGFEPQFKEQLHEGVEFDLIERRTDWLLIQLPDGKTGWIRSREAETV
jgi:hypothetical protein